MTASTIIPTQPADRVADRLAPKWATRLAHAIPFLVLPSGLWRFAVAFGFAMGQLDDAGHLSTMHGWSSVYVAATSLLTEVVALTAFGLVQPLGREVPRWVPHFGGRSVRPKTVLVVATLGSVALVAIWTAGFWSVWTGHGVSNMAGPSWEAVFIVCYAPLNLWGPSLLALTWSFRQRLSPAVHHGVEDRAGT